MTDVFHETLPAGREFFSPAIWEITRFCIDDDRAVEHFGSAAAFHAAKLMFLTFGDFALSNGIDTLLATIDVRMLRLIRRAGITLDVLESTASFGTHRVYSVLFPVSVEGRHKLRQAFGVTGNVFDLKRPFDTAGPSHVPASAAA